MQSIKLNRKSYGPPRRPVLKQYSSKLEAIENFKNKIISNEYLDSISSHFKHLESQTTVNPAMIDLQPEVKWFMRPYLVNFIIQMHSSLKLKPQTLFLCWNIIDRYCAKRIAFKQHYQLIGCTSLWIASKYEDKKSRVPTVKELNTMCSNVYDDSMFREMEIHILSTLDWSVGHTTHEDILQLAVKYADPDGKESLTRPIEIYKNNTPTVSAILAVSRYLCELSLYERNYLNYSTSMISITCFLMACSILNMDFGSNYINDIFTLFENSMNINKSNIHSTPKTPVKDLQFFSFTQDENNDEFDDYDSDTENIEPKKQNYGPFIEGFNGIETINQLRSISLNLFKSILDPSEVLVEKYSSLGVITVVKRFLNDNDLYQIDASLIPNGYSEHKNDNQNDNDDDEILQNSTKNLNNPYSIELTNLLLSFNDASPFMDSTIRNLSISTDQFINSDSMLFTPCDSPSNFSSFSSVSSATTYSFSSNISDYGFNCNDDAKEKII